MTQAPGYLSVIAMIFALITAFVGIGAVRNARRLNEQKHRHRQVRTGR